MTEREKKEKKRKRETEKLMREKRERLRKSALDCSNCSRGVIHGDQKRGKEQLGGNASPLSSAGL